MDGKNDVKFELLEVVVKPYQGVINSICSAEALAGFGSRTLSIAIDLDHIHYQPLTSNVKKYITEYYGIIYPTLSVMLVNNNILKISVK